MAEQETAQGMMQIAVIGGPEFTLGFRIAGIRDVHDVEKQQDAAAKMRELMQAGKTGIIIADEKAMGLLDEKTREAAEAAVKPVTVVVSAEASAQETLRKMIIKSIGVDLWKD